MRRRTLLALITVVALGAALFGFIASRPGTFHVERSIVIHAPQDVVFPWVQDTRRWSRWAPWVRAEQVQPDSRAHANGDAPPIAFIDALPANGRISFDFRPASGGLAMTCKVHGEHDFLAKAGSLFTNLDKAVGRQFEAGLANLKELAEDEVGRRANSGARAPEPAAADPAVAPVGAKGL